MIEKQIIGGSDQFEQSAPGIVCHAAPSGAIRWGHGYLLGQKDQLEIVMVSTLRNALYTSVLLLCGGVVSAMEISSRGEADASLPRALDATNEPFHFASDPSEEDLFPATFAKPDVPPTSCADELPWKVSAEALFWQRQQPGPALLMFNTVSPSEAIRAADFDYGFHAGTKLSLTRHIASGRSLEVSWSSLDAWHAQTRTATTPGSLLRVTSIIPVFALAGDRIEAASSSELQSLELNLFSDRQEPLRLLLGLRYFELDEQVGWQLINPPTPFVYATATDNRLYGAQAGVDLRLWDRGGPMTIELLGKAGLYLNDADHMSRYATNVVSLSAGDSTTQLAFAGEFQIAFHYQLSDQWKVRAGYQSLWIEQAALAVDQIAVSDFVFDQGLDARGDVFYHGASVGLEFLR